MRPWPRCNLIIVVTRVGRSGDFEFRRTCKAELCTTIRVGPWARCGAGVEAAQVKSHKSQVKSDNDPTCAAYCDASLLRALLGDPRSLSPRLRVVSGSAFRLAPQSATASTAASSFGLARARHQVRAGG